jgi:hypothetical protein
VVELLGQLPGVARAEVGVQAEKPTCRIVHLRDWHFVPRDLFTIELRQTGGREWTAEEIEQQHQELLLEVEAVQLEQLAVLRCLIRHHQLGDIRGLLQGMDPDTDRHRKAKQIEAEIAEMLHQYRVRLLELGAPGRLLIAGEIDEVLPLDDAGLLDRAQPVTPEGKVRLDPEKLKARQDAQVQAVRAKGGLGLIVLGGAHDLSDCVRRLGRGQCEYIRVTTRRFQEFSE